MASRAPANARPAERFAVWGRAVGTSVLIVLSLLWCVAVLNSAGRFRAAAAAGLVAAAATLLPRVTLGFEDLSWYPRVVRHVTEFEAERSYSVLGMLDSARADPFWAEAVAGMVVLLRPARRHPFQEEAA